MRWRTGGRLGYRQGSPHAGGQKLQSADRTTSSALSRRLPLLWKWGLRLGIQRHFSCEKFGQLTEGLVGIPSLVVQGDGLSSSNHFGPSLAARLGAGPTAPDLVWLQRSPHRRRLSFQSSRFSVYSCASVSPWQPAGAPLPHFSRSLPPEESHLQDVSVDAVVLLSPSTPSADYGD